MSELLKGTLLQNGKYEILRTLGQGGFGITYLAKHQLLGEVVVKELFLYNSCTRKADRQTVDTAIDKTLFETFKKKFLEEARLLVKFKEVKGISTVLDFFEENNTVYFSMEYIQAVSLADYVLSKGKLSEKEAIKYILQVSRDLEVVHRQGVLHRDIKPQNILLTPEGKTVLIDFGIAREFEEGNTAHHTTYFTPGYAAPEQMTESDKRGAYTDIYSLGATLYFLLTAQHPQTLGQISINGYVPVRSVNPAVSEGLNRIITQSMELRREKRYQSLNEWVSEIEKLERAGFHKKDDFLIDADESMPEKKPEPVQPPPPVIKKSYLEETVEAASRPYSQSPEPVIHKNKPVNRDAIRAIVTFLVVVVALVTMFVIFKPENKTLKKSKAAAKNTSAHDSYDNGERALEVEFVQNENASGLIPSWQEAVFNQYDDAYSCKIKGYLKLDKIEVSKLSLEVEFYGENGDLLETKAESAHSDSDPALRNGDLLPVSMLIFEQKRAEKPYKKAKIKVTYIQKQPSAATFAKGKPVTVSWVNSPGDSNTSLSIRERKSRFSDALNSGESYHAGEWEVENTGNTSFEQIKVAFCYKNASGKILDETERYIISDSEPKIQSGQTFVFGSTMGCKARTKEIAGYEIRILEWK
ncbi:MAG: serine/threonine protein kinase [Bacteroidia bacterium]|nr:serine/threonine protein kinase [Bacteroidia bacterium]